MFKEKPKRLYRSPDERIIAGVCGGIAEYFNIEPTWIRIIFLVLLLAFGATLFIYLILWIIVPKKPPNVIIDHDPNPRDNSHNSL